MNTRSRFYLRSSLALAKAASLCPLVLCVLPRLQAADFIKPTSQELSMKELPGYPGAAAVILFREELTNDDMHSVEHYERIKILTPEGKKYANVELGYVTGLGTAGYYGDDKSLEQISGRTINADGTVIPFTGKPYLKVLEKTTGYKVQQKVFTLPDVEVGSIIEYRYFTRISDYTVEAPTWMIQDDLYVKSAHFAWWPTRRTLIDEEQNPINSIAWFPVLPQGAQIESHEITRSAQDMGANREYEIHVKDIPPRVREEFMPPISSYSYRVNFSFTPYRSGQEYWQHAGKQWSKRVNSFAGPNSALRDATAKVTAGANTPEEKLHKIYAAVMALENTQFTRERDQREDKAAGMGQVKEASDVLTRGRGTPNQLAELFLGMTRAAGLQAYAMWVPDRSERIFIPSWLQSGQLDDYIVIVSVGGKDVFFDPGSRYCGFGELAWQHTLVGGVRQTDSGTTLAETSSATYKANQTARVANLTMSSGGQVTGTVDLTFNGAPAVYWRQAALRGDEEGLRKELRETAEEMLPRTLDLEVADIQDAASFEKPLKVRYKVTGTLGNSMGKRTVLPVDVFRANSRSTFSQEKRDTSVYFHYPQSTRDAVRINVPQEMSIEAVPASTKLDLPNRGVYSLQVTQGPTSVTTRRDLLFNDVLVEPKDYTQLRTFYSQLESKDQEPVILKPAAVAATTSASSAAGH